MTDGIVKHKTVMPASVGPVEEEGAEEIIYEYLGFELSDEHYALPLTAVREILKLPAVTGVPRAPEFVLGVISVRGRITTVVDLRRRLRMPEAPLTKAARVLLVDDGDEVVGVLVDRVLSVFRLLEEEVELAAAVGGDTADYVVGVGRPLGLATRGRGVQKATGERRELLILLDPRALLRR